MSNEIKWRHSATGASLYFTIRTSLAGTYWNQTATANFETINVANWTSSKYCIGMSEAVSGSYLYSGTFPAVSGNMVAGWYWVDLFLQAGGSPAISDTPVASWLGYWNGTNFVATAESATQATPSVDQTGDAYSYVVTNVGANGVNLTNVGGHPQSGDAYAYVVANLGAAGANATALAQASIWTSTVAGRIDATISSRSTLTQTQVTGGAYALNTDGSGNIKVSSGTGANQISLSSGLVTFGNTSIATVTTVTNAVNLPSSVPSGYATSANQTSILSAISAITANTARGKIVIPTWMARPASSSTNYEIDVNIYSLQGQLEAPDAAPTIHARNSAGTSLDSGLSSTTMTLVSTGKYKITYTVNSSDTAQEVLFDVTWNVNSVAFAVSDATVVEDAEMLSTLSAIKTQTDKIGTTSADSSNVTAIKAKTDLIATNSADSPNAVTAQTAAGNSATAVTSITFGNSALLTAINTRSTLTQAQVTGGAFSIQTDGSGFVKAKDTNGQTIAHVNFPNQGSVDSSGNFQTTGGGGGGGGGTGSGAWTVTLTVNDGTNPVQNANVRLTNGADSFVTTTDVNGTAVFNLDSATWTVAITRSGYSFGGASLVVGSSTSHAYSLSVTSLLPSNVGAVTGYSYAYDNVGNVAAGINISLSLYLLSGSVNAVPSAQTATAISGSDGLFQFPNLIPGATYMIQRGSVKVWQPESDGTYDLGTVSQAAWSKFTVPSTQASPFQIPGFFGEEDLS